MIDGSTIKALHTNAVVGAHSTVTKREATGDKSVTLDKFEKSVLYNLIPASNIVRKGGVANDTKASHHKFMILDSSIGKFEEAENALTFPKGEKNELRLYFKKRKGANFYPTEGQQFFIFQVAGDSRPYIGAMDSSTFNGTISSQPQVRSFTKGLSIDEDDFDYQTLVHQPIAAGGAKQSTKNTFNRSQNIARKAIKAAQYKCQEDASHWTCESGATGKPYLEPHHLVPMSLQPEFKNSLDCVANLVVLCPTCHRAIHYGDLTTKRGMLAKFFKSHVGNLAKSGIDIELPFLLEKYGVS